MHFNQAPFASCAVLAKLWTMSWQSLLTMLRELYLRCWEDPCRDTCLLGALTAQAWICLPCSCFLVYQQHRHGVLQAAKWNSWASVGGLLGRVYHLSDLAVCETGDKQEHKYEWV